jgi:hypothetical protein
MVLHPLYTAYLAIRLFAYTPHAQYSTPKAAPEHDGVARAVVLHANMARERVLPDRELEHATAARPAAAKAWSQPTSAHYKWANAHLP